jgi:ABC-type branched-subunit amino acid transport system substrate-binding protein
MQVAMQLQPYLDNGNGIELVVEDDKNEPALTVTLLKKLVKEVGVSAIITFSSTSPVLAMAKVADDYKTPVLAAVATHPDITKDNGFINQLVFDDNFQGIVAVSLSLTTIFRGLLRLCLSETICSSTQLPYLTTRPAFTPAIWQLNLKGSSNPSAVK